MTWRAARSLLVLHRQLQAGAPRAKPPGTGADEWGLIGDAEHDPSSDHSPHDFSGWGSQIVTAGDFPNRPDLGLDAHAVLDDIRRARDPRAKYGISNGQIWSNHSVDGYAAWTWRPYSGSSDKHFTHGHLSVVGDSRADGEQPWPTIGADDMEQTDKLIAPWNDGTVGNALAVVMEERKGLWVDVNGTGYGAPKPNSALGLILGKLDALLGRPTVDVAALAAALQGPLAEALGHTVEQDALVGAVQAALDSPEGQAALTQAANTAEDS